MEGLQKLARTISKDANIGSSLTENLYNSGGGAGASLPSVDKSQILVSRQPRQGVSLSTCSKLCAVCFIAGVFVGFTLKRRVRQWASKLLQKLKDN